MIQISLLVADIAQAPMPSDWPPLRESDRVVLEELYRVTGGDGWKQHKGWNSPANPCDWYGVFCDVEAIDSGTVAVVASLDLADNGLHGRLPESLATLSGLHPDRRFA